MSKEADLFSAGMGMLLPSVPVCLAAIDKSQAVMNASAGTGALSVIFLGVAVTIGHFKAEDDSPPPQVIDNIHAEFNFKLFKGAFLATTLVVSSAMSIEMLNNDGQLVPPPPGGHLRYK